MICVFNKGVKGRGGGPWSSIFKEGEGGKGDTALYKCLLLLK